MAETHRRIFWWDCSRCSARMAQRATEAEVMRDRDAHLSYCYPVARRAQWELHIATALITDYA